MLIEQFLAYRICATGGIGDHCDHQRLGAQRNDPWLPFDFCGKRRLLACLGQVGVTVAGGKGCGSGADQLSPAAREDVGTAAKGDRR